jgi:hypothetical protein
MKRIMFDIETTGVDPRFNILQIAWITFGGEEDMIQKSYPISFKELVWCPQTLEWWMKTAPEKLLQLLMACHSSKARDCREVILELAADSMYCDEIWSNGDFDLLYIVHRLNSNPFGKKWRDLRTLKKVMGYKSISNLTHDALEDCQAQINMLLDMETRLSLVL